MRTTLLTNIGKKLPRSHLTYPRQGECALALVILTGGSLL
jgi:hypothetical protein